MEAIVERNERFVSLVFQHPFEKVLGVGQRLLAYFHLLPFYRWVNAQVRVTLHIFITFKILRFKSVIVQRSPRPRGSNPELDRSINYNSQSVMPTQKLIIKPTNQIMPMQIRWL